MNKVTVIIPNYNGLKFMEPCFAALERQNYRDFDILVVDNASTDGTAQALKQMPSPRLFYRNTGENLGGAGGFHFGMRWAVEEGYDYVWIMDDDSLPQPRALAELWAAHEQLNGEYGWLSSRCLWTDGELCPMNVQRVTPYKDLAEPVQKLAPVQMASFVSLFLKASVIETVGLPLRQFFIWTDDWEYTRRISRMLPCYAVWGSTVVHAMKSKTIVNIATDAPERMFRYRYFYRNDVYLYRREGLKGWLWLLAKDAWHSVQVLQKGSNKLGKLKIIWGGLFKGLVFNPQVEYCDFHK